MTALEHPAPRRHRFTAAECRRGGQTAAARLTRAQRQAGGRARGAQPACHELLRAQAPRGGQATLARYGADVLVARIAAQKAAQPTRLEQFVYAELERRGIPYGRQQVVRVGGRLRVLDAMVRRRDLAPDAPAGTLVMEPGDRRYHGGPAETWDGRDHAALDEALDAQLARQGYYVLRLDNLLINGAPDEARRRIGQLLEWGTTGEYTT
jgi:hypothetical protein